MPDPSPDLPEVEPRDPEPVAVAIETARALFRSGERLDALRWLRRAAERAEEAGDDVRSVSLARSAADLSTELQSMPPPPPLVPSAAPSEVASAPAATSRRYDAALFDHAFALIVDSGHRGGSDRAEGHAQARSASNTARRVEP